MTANTSNKVNTATAAAAASKAVQAVGAAESDATPSKVSTPGDASPNPLNSGKTQTLPLVNVSIERGRDTIVTDVPEHEIAILKIVHGEHNVQVNEDADEDEAEFTKDADTEFQRLQAKYRRVNAADPVTIAYPLGAKSLDGFTLGRGRHQAAPQSSAVNHAKEARKAARK
jgi:hypothetical protein